MTKIYRYVYTPTGEKKWTANTSKDSYDEYVLEITPKWNSSLDGNPVAILVEAEHINDDLSEYSSNKYSYKCLWANYNTSEDESTFKSLDLLEDTEQDCEILIYKGFKKDNNYYINSTIDKNCIISISILRIYDGVIKFKLTPIMSYGPLENLSKTITVDQSKIASGEIILSKWSYYLTQNQSSVVKDFNKKTSKSTDHKTSKTTKITTKSSTSNGDTTNPVTSDSETITETYTSENTSDVYDYKRDSYITYQYTLDITYGFDSYMYENQHVHKDKSYIYFFDIEELPLGKYKGNAYDIIKQILKDYDENNIKAVYREFIPYEIIRGGNTTNKYNLNSSSCKLEHNKLYLAVINLETKLDNDDILLEHYDYRYLYTNQIFNNYFNNSEDFDVLSIPIDPVLNIEFGEKSSYKYISKENKECSYKDIYNNLTWVQNSKKFSEYTFKFQSQINNTPNHIQILFEQDGFNAEHVIKDSLQNFVTLTYDYPQINDYKNNVLNTSTTQEQFTNWATPVSLTKEYTFNIDCVCPQNSVLVGAIKTNLLNTISKVDEYKLYLSELNGLSNTMMFEPDSIFTVGMHNDGNDDDEEWYGEAGSTSEGYTSVISSEYDDSLGFNRDNELSMDYYDSQTAADPMYYYLKHSADHLKQFGQGKSDVSEAFSTYMEGDDQPQEIQASLECRGIAPLLFVTSGYSQADANKTDTCVWTQLGEYKAPSQPANGNVLNEQDDEDEERNNFNKEHPYWFINWTAVNAFNLKQFLGTFMLKYSTKFGSSRYVTSNNYFMIMCPADKGPVSTLYLEDLIRSHYEYNFQGSSIPKNDPKNIIFDTPKCPSGEGERIWKSSDVTASAYVHNPASVSQTIGVKSVDQTFNITHSSYSPGDLLATQLAQFATITNYVIPTEMATTIYTISDEHKQLVNQLSDEQIQYTRTYAVQLTNSIYDKLNKNLTFNTKSLDSLNKLLPSKNLTVLELVSGEKSELKYSEKITFNPLNNLLPDFNDDVYLAEITPYGNVLWYPKPSISNSNSLYVWNDKTGIYEPYNSAVGAQLYKYGKFSKFSYIGSSKDTFFNDYNKFNYNNLEEESELLEGFIKFHPMKSSNTITPTHIIKSSLHYNSNYGLYTSDTKGRDFEMKFYFKTTPCNTSGNHKDRQADDERAFRAITKIATPPYTRFKGNSPFTYVDPKYRV